MQGRSAQIDNEYMHSSAAWEITTGIADEWIFGGDDGEAYMYALRDLAKECGIVTPFYDLHLQLPLYSPL